MSQKSYGTISLNKNVHFLKFSVRSFMIRHRAGILIIQSIDRTASKADKNTRGHPIFLILASTFQDVCYAIPSGFTSRSRAIKNHLTRLRGRSHHPLRVRANRRALHILYESHSQALGRAFFSFTPIAVHLPTAGHARYIEPRCFVFRLWV